MAKRIFLGTGKNLPEQIAVRVLESCPASAVPVPDLGNILLALPGKLARQKVMRHLADKAANGLLLPQMLTPALLMRYGMAEMPRPSGAVNELLWMQTVKTALRTPERFDLVFPEAEKMPPEHSFSGRKLMDFRHEVISGGFSLAEIAPHLGARGEQLAALEKLYLQQLQEYGFTDTLALDRLAAEDISAFVPGMKIILAGVPDLPNMLKRKLEKIDLAYPDMIEIWIHAPESQADEFDQWGIPLPEVWGAKALDGVAEFCHKALDPADAARLSARLVTDGGAFEPAKYAIVLSDPGMITEFQKEFGKFTAPDGTPLAIYDPAGIPLSKLRLCRIGNALREFLHSRGDFLYAAELLKEHDYLLHLSSTEIPSAAILEALDVFAARFVPDELAGALRLADSRELGNIGYGVLRDALHELDFWQQRFARVPVTEFLWEFFTAVYPPQLAIDSENYQKVSFAAECAAFREALAEFERIPEKLLSGEKLRVLDIFFRYCGNMSVAAAAEEYSFGVEGCLEIPFLDAEKVVFCGMNEKYFPDRIELTPFLTDTLRRQIGLRSNRETAARARCHLQSLLACRKSGDVDFIILRQDSEKLSLRPSRLLFAGSDLPGGELLKRCRMFFSDPEPLGDDNSAGGSKIFRFRPELHCKSDPVSGKIMLSPTDLDDYLSSPYLFYLRRICHAGITDYSCEEPDPRTAGTIYHEVFERLGSARYPSAEKYAGAMLSLLDDILAEKFGPHPQPVFITLMAANMRQRLNAAAGVLFAGQQEGFIPIKCEYRFERLPFAGALFTGQIDRIEYHPGRNVFRIIDIKTGAPENVVQAHCKKGKKGLIFTKLQLPLYVLLLRQDPVFRAEHPEIAGAEIECGYLNLPQSVTETAIQIWPPDELNSILDAVKEKTETVIAEISRFPRQILCEDPDRFSRTVKDKDMRELFPAGLRNGLTGVCWEYDREGEASTEEKSSTEKNPLAPNIRNTPFLTPPRGVDGDAARMRCCDCPPEKQAKCPCRGKNAADCQAFNGFKSFNIITASAGTGKTYSLASRFIQLLGCGADPAQIMAVTFTKKAAGEIFDKIIGRMLEFARGSKRNSICRNLSRDEIIRILRELLNSEKELQISTIDSFFMRLLTAYTPELGIWGDVSMIDSSDIRPVRRSFREWVRGVAAAGTEKLAVLRELLKDANSSENKNFARSMMSLLKDVYPFYLLKLHRRSDGSMPQLTNFPWAPAAAEYMPPEQLQCAAEQLTGFAFKLDEEADFCTNGSYKKSMRGNAEKLRKLAAFLPKSSRFFGKLDSDAEALFANIAKYNGNMWSAGNGQLMYTSKLSFSPELSGLLRQVFCHIRAGIFAMIRAKNIAVFELMKEFDAVYHAKVRSAGLLNFTDLAYLLCHADPDSGEAILGPENRTLEMRLDAEINHYMFDEFQDTSDIQWQAFDALIKELFSGESERFRSFFCVGDIKQSIYQWRDGNPELFGYLTELATPAAEKNGYEVQESLTLSYRSCRSVLDTVNVVFAPGYSGNLPYFAQAQQKMAFEPHFAADETLEGFAALIGCERVSGRDHLCVVAKAEMIFEILRGIRPFDKNLTVGILVQKNSTVELFADELRRLSRERDFDLPVSSEGVVSINESMAFTVFRFMLVYAEHPGDALAQELLNTLTFDLPENDPEALTLPQIASRMGFDADLPLADSLREELFRGGIAGLAQRFIAGFGREMTAFDLKRMQNMALAAEKFTGTPAEFIESAAFLGVADGALEQTVQVMTYHKSKGLEFDIVFLPDTGIQPGNSGGNLLPAVQIRESAANAMQMPEWISYVPPAGIAGEIPPFAENAEKKKAAQAFEKCCALYVALTRAKRALYVLVSPSKSDSASMALDQLLLERLGSKGVQMADLEYFEALRQRCHAGNRMSVHFSCGRESWHGLIPESKPQKKQMLPIPRQISCLPDKNIFLRASDEKSAPLTPSSRFATVGGSAVGTLVHELFEKISRITPEWDAEAFCRQHLPETPFGAAAGEIFCRVLEAPSEIREMLEKTPPECEVWSERRFLLRHRDGTMVPGAFDRVVIYREESRIVRAEILDWKSDNLSAPEDFLIYTGQLKLYRESLARLLELPESAISCRIAALKLKKLIPIA